MKEQLTIGIVGLSHLGIVSSIGFASMGFRVIGIDKDKKTVSSLRKGNDLPPEPSLDELFSKYKNKIMFSSDFSLLNQCHVVFLAKDTPVDQEKNEMALDKVWELINLAIPHFVSNTQFIVMSQVPPGFTRSIDCRIQELRPGLRYSIYYFVETLIIGDAVNRFLKPERMIFGSKTPKVSLGGFLEEIARHFSCPLITVRLESAEMTKSAMNVYLATTVTFANTLADICEVVGADITEIIPAIRLDKRAGPYTYIQPGLGLSGGHLERDIVMLSHVTHELNVKAGLLELIQQVSSSRYQWLCNKLEKEVFVHTPFPRIAIWGLSYKKNTNSIHGSTSLKIIRDFGERAMLVAYDPAVKLSNMKGVSCVDEKYKAVEDADCLLILNNWDEFKDIDKKRIRKAMKTPFIIDGPGVLAESEFVEENIKYIVMGRSDAQKYENK